MSYNTINACANDSAFRSRVTACAAQEGAYSPENAGYLLMWPISVESDVEAAYASALAANNPNPGGDESVITDGMILSKVQANWNVEWEQPPTPPTPA
jgi:hypothetical protein